MSRFSKLHDWDVTPKEAIQIQEQFRSRVITTDDLPDGIRRVAGIDIGFEEGGKVTRAAVVVLALPQLTVCETRLVKRKTTFPYVPGLLSFREIPAALVAMEQIDTLPDLVICDGQGIAHPRRMGLATHLGLAMDLPTIGAAKSRLTGEFGRVPRQKGRSTPLFDGDEQIGLVLRTRTDVRPLFVSVGHRVSLNTARDLVMQCVTCYRLPETTRLAHRLCSA